MHGGHLQSVYLAAPKEGAFSPRPEESQPETKPPAAAPPKTLPRSTVPPPKQPVATVPRPVTIGTLREAKAATATRVPITQRTHEPEVPARLKLKKKTVAFGVTTNVSQTVEREKDPHPTEPHPRAAAAASKPPAPPPRMSLARAGVGADRSAGTRPATRQTTPPPSRAPLRDENRMPAGGGGGAEERESRRDEMKDSIARLEARIAELERAERKQRESAAEMQRGFDRVVKIVSTLTERVAELELEKENGGGREKGSEANGHSRPRRRLSFSDEDVKENGMGREDERMGRRTGGTGTGLLSDQEALRALDRQMSTNPVLRRQLQDAIEQDKYDHEYGGRGGGGARRTASPPQRRDYFDEYASEPRAATGRCGGAGSAPNHQRWKEEPPRRERLRTTPPGGGGRAGVTRKRTEITPSRRRVTERVTMERVHHFDDTDDESDGGGGGDVYNRYDSDDQQYPAQTQYSEEIVESADFQSVIQPKGRAAYGGGRQPAPRRTQQQQHYGSPRRGAPLITEMDDSDGDSLERKQRKIREMKEEKRERARR